MLEDIALQYSELPEDEMRALSYGLVILGGKDRSCDTSMRLIHLQTSFRRICASVCYNRIAPMKA